MTERPILFSGPLVRAILDGRKSQTRRILKAPPWQTKPKPPLPPVTAEAIDSAISWRHWSEVPGGTHEYMGDAWAGEVAPGAWSFGIPSYANVGDRLWVREAWGVSRVYDDTKPRDIHPGAKVAYGADKPKGIRLRPSIHMPRWASRITLEVTSVRVERVQEITAPDVRREGVKCIMRSEAAYVATFARLWDSINAKRGFGWNVNPWVWVVDFRRVGE